MSKKRYIASDPTAWTAISWADKEATRAKTRPMAITLENGRKKKRKEKSHEVSNSGTHGNDGVYKDGEY